MSITETIVKSNATHMAQLGAEARYYYCIGGRWSGKTYEVLSENVDQAISNENLRITAARKVYNSIKNTLFDDFLTVMNDMHLEENKHYTKTVSPLHIKFYNGSDIIFIGVDSPEKTKGISRSHRLIMEECNEFTEQDFETLDMSMRGKIYALKTYLMHNPVPIVPGATFWFQKKFDKGTLEPGKPKLYLVAGLGKVCALKSTYLHNAFCPPAIRERLEGYKITNPNLYELWTLGNYAKMEGLVFNNWDVVDKVPDNVDTIGCGLDFGFSNHPSASLRVWATSDEIWVKGLVYKTGLKNKDLFDRMRQEGVELNDFIVADSAEPKSIAELRDFGFSAIQGVKKKARYKEDMVNVLKGYKIHVVTGDTDLQREFSTYSWAKNSKGEYVNPPKLQDGDDHYMDAFIMITYTRLKKPSKPKRFYF